MGPEEGGAHRISRGQISSGQESACNFVKGNVGLTPVQPRSTEKHVVCIHLSQHSIRKRGHKLASLIPNKRYPDKDQMYGEEVNLDPTKGVISKTVHKNFHGRIEFSSDSFSKVQITKVFSRLLNHDSGIDHHISAKEAWTYLLLHPKTQFSELCKRESVQKWLEVQYKEKCKVYFVIGYRTLINATVSLGLSDNSPATVRFEPVGERVYAVCYCKVGFKFSKGSKSAYLKSNKEWTSFVKSSGNKSPEKVIIQVDLEDEIYDENEVAREASLPNQVGGRA